MIARTMMQTRELTRRSAERREKYPSPTALASCVFVFFLTALAISGLNAGFLLFGWLMMGPLAIAVYVTLDIKGPLVNAYTVLFGMIAASSFAAYAVTGL